MLILLLIAIVFILARLMPKPPRLDATPPTAANELPKDIIYQDIKKNCPPHKWRYVEVKDLEGVTRSWRMVCDLCGPLKPLR